MGNTGSIVGQVLGGFGLTLAGIATLNPALIGIGAMTGLSGAIQGFSSQAAGDRDARNAQAGEESIARNRAQVQQEATAHARAVSNVMGDARAGAYGPAAASAMDAFAKAASAGRTMSGALASAGILPGFNRSVDRRNTAAMNRAVGNEAFVSLHFGDPMFSTFARRARNTGRAATDVYNHLRDTRIASAFMDTYAPRPVQQTYGGGAAAAQSYEARIASGQITAQTGGTYYALSAE